MRPKDRSDDGGEDLFQSRLLNIINPRHELVRLAEAIDWSRFDDAFGEVYTDKGRPALTTRLRRRFACLKWLG